MNIYKYMLFVYINYIQEDWSLINKIGRFFLKPAWFVRSVIIWSLSMTIGIPFILLHMEYVNTKKLIF